MTAVFRALADYLKVQNVQSGNCVCSNISTHPPHPLVASAAESLTPSTYKNMPQFSVASP